MKSLQHKCSENKSEKLELQHQIESSEEFQSYLQQEFDAYLFDIDAVRWVL